MIKSWYLAMCKDLYKKCLKFHFYKTYFPLCICNSLITSVYNLVFLPCTLYNKYRKYWFKEANILHWKVFHSYLAIFSSSGLNHIIPLYDRQIEHKHVNGKQENRKLLLNEAEYFELESNFRFLVFALSKLT